MLGPVLGGWLIDADLWGLGWRTVFLINIPVGIVIFVLAARFVPETRSERPMRLDLVGVVLLSAIVLAFMVPLVEGQSLGWPAWLWIPVAAGALLLVVFVAYSRRRMRRDGSALLPMPLFADRGFSAGIVTQATFQGSLNAFTLPFIIYLQVGLGFDALTAGLNLLAFSLGALLGTGVVIPLVARVGKYLVTLGAVLLGAGLLWVFAIVAETGAEFSGWAAVWPMLLSGVGLALLVIPLVDVALATVPVADAGAASGAYSTFQQLGAAAGVAVSTTVFFTVVGDDWSREHLVTALQASVWVAVAGFAIAALASLLLPSRSKVQAHLDEARRLAEADADGGGGGRACRRTVAGGLTRYAGPPPRSIASRARRSGLPEASSGRRSTSSRRTGRAAGVSPAASVAAASVVRASDAAAASVRGATTAARSPHSASGIRTATASREARAPPAPRARPRRATPSRRPR